MEGEKQDSSKGIFRGLAVLGIWKSDGLDQTYLHAVEATDMIREL